jgi:hypothetical protein
VALDIGITDPILKKCKDVFLSEENSPQKSTLENENLKLQ